MHKRFWFLSVWLILAMVLPIASLVNAAPLLQEGQEYVIQAGDTLAGLAEQYIGTAEDVVAIIAATAEKAATDETFAKINDPDQIEVGWKVWIPSKDKAKEYLQPLPDLGGKKVIVGTDPTYPPFEYPDEATGAYIGYDVDMVNDLCARLNCKPEFVATAWDGIFVALAAGEFDMVASGATITAEREEIVDFSYPYLVYGQILLLAADSSAQRVEDLKDKPIGVQLGTTNDLTATELFGDANVKRYDTFDMAVIALLQGDVSAVVIDLPSAVGFMEQYPGRLKVGPELTSGEALGMAFPPGSELRAAFNAALVRFKADGSYAKLYNKYFGGPEAATKMPGPVTELLVVGTTDKMTVFDPADVYDFHAWEIWNNTGDGLLNNEPGSAGKAVPGLAERYEASDDGMEYTFYLRKGVKFPDGTPFNAEAVKWTIERVIKMNEALGGEVAFLVSDYVDKVDVIDEYTVKFTLKTPVGFFPNLVASNPYKIISPKAWGMDAYEADNTSGGIGPYKITSWKRDEELVMEANPDYYGNPPKSKKVIIRYFADSATMRLALEKGEIDIAWKSLAGVDLKSLEGKPGIVIERQPGTEIRYICYNCKTPPFDDKRVRNALAMMLDREEIADVGFQGNKVPLYSMIPPGFLGHNPDYYGDADVEAAKALLKEVGFDENNPLKMDFWYSPSHYGDTEADVAAIIKDQWEKSGVVKVNLQSAEWATYKQYRNAGNLPVFLLGWYPDYLDSDNYTYPFGHTGATDGLGVFYSNPEMDKLLEAAQVERDEAKRAELYDQIQKLWPTENPTTPFAQGALTVAYREGVKGIVLDPLALFHYYLVYKEG